MNIKQIVIDFLMSIVIDTLFFLILNECISKRYAISKDYNKELDAFMYNAYNQSKDKHGTIKSVDGFNVVKNTLPFPNITIDPKDEGNCLGYCYVTRELFQDTLIKIFRRNFKKVYDIKFLKDKELNAFTIREIKINNKIRYEISKNVFEILKAVTYYQLRVNKSTFKYSSDEVMPKIFRCKRTATTCHFIYLISRMGFLKMKMHKKLDLHELLLKRLDANKLVIISMNGLNKKANEGHSVLAYKYEMISDDEIKVFVYDCNIPITEDSNISDSVFILFKLIDGEWQYIYRPLIGIDYYIDCDYNSYAPQATIKFM
jgi:hypothetical protein